jgi:hypothetical protein
MQSTSAPGQSRRFCHVRVMSAQRPLSDVRGLCAPTPSPGVGGNQCQGLGRDHTCAVFAAAPGRSPEFCAVTCITRHCAVGEPPLSGKRVCCRAGILPNPETNGRRSRLRLRGIVSAELGKLAQPAQFKTRQPSKPSKKGSAGRIKGLCLHRPHRVTCIVLRCVQRSWARWDANSPNHDLLLGEEK